MQKLIIKRSSEWTNKFRAIAIYLDGKKIGDIEYGEIKEFEIEPGIHNIKAKIDWCRSNSLELYIEDNQTKCIELSGFKFSKFLMPVTIVISLIYFIFEKQFNLNPAIFLLLILPPSMYLFYHLTFRRNKYLNLKEI